VDSGLSHFNLVFFAIFRYVNLMDVDLVYLVFLLLGLGAVGGFLAGLLGIGGGAIFVPGLYYIFAHSGYEQHAMHIAVGTSLLTIVLTGTSSAYAHYKKGAIDLELLKGFLPGVVIGVSLGSFFAGIVSTLFLKSIFAISQLSFGSYMLIRGHKTHLFNAMPKQPYFSLISLLNSCLASMMGVGGGVQNILFMSICNVPIHRAIATAAAIGPFIAMIGACGFLYIGLDALGLPPMSIGYINLAAFSVLIISGVIFAPLGAHVAHKLPVPKLKRFFSIFMLLIAAKMLSEIYF